MLRRRGRGLLIATVVLAAGLIAAGCGRDDFKNDPRPPVPDEVSVKIGTGGVAISPKKFGSGLVNFTIANLTTRTARLALHGPVDAESDVIPAGAAETLKVETKPGNYEASVSGIAVRPYSFTVGPERPSGQNDLLLP